MKKTELLERLRHAVSSAEWELLACGSPLAVSNFNRSVLLELRHASITEDRELPMDRAAGLYAALRAYLAEQMQPEGWKWVILSSLYLALIAERPLHPVEQLGIKVTETEGGTLYECPAKPALKHTICDYCVCRRMSNYEMTKRQMAQKFTAYDQAEMIRRFRLDSTEEWLFIRFLNAPYQISRSSGTIYRLEDGAGTEAGFNEAMTIYDVLCSAKAGCALSGEFVNLGGLMKAANAPGQKGGLFDQKNRIFDHREDTLRQACEQLGGERYGKGDVAYRLPLFDFLPVVFQFWSADEEFPASLQLLWDKNTLHFMHYETVWYAAGYLLDRLTDLVSDGPIIHSPEN